MTSNQYLVTETMTMKSIIDLLQPMLAASGALKGGLLGLAGIVLSGVAGCTTVGTVPAQEDRLTTEALKVEHIRITSNRSFDDVKAALESRLKTFEIDRLMPFVQKGDMVGARGELERVASPSGLSILYSLNHGGALAIGAGKPSKAVGYGIGNVLTATSMTKHNLAAGLYAPVRVVLYEGANGTAVIEYDKPSSMFALFRDPAIDSAAIRLDVLLKDMLKDVSN